MIKKKINLHQIMQTYLETKNYLKIINWRKFQKSLMKRVKENEPMVPEIAKTEK